MKTTGKILVLAISFIIAIAAVMVYAKTQVEPPTALKQANQYDADLRSCIAALAQADGYLQEDSIFAVTSDRIGIFAGQEKISETDADRNTDALLSRYVPLFLKRSFGKFLLSSWSDADHDYMLAAIARIRAVRHCDNTVAATRMAQDSLSEIVNIIGRYRKARALSRHTAFRGIGNAQSVISQARQYAKDPWLSHCTGLVEALSSVRSGIALSHYNYLVGQVLKMAQYRSYSQSYYENSLVPQVDAALTEYENRASALYGSRRNVEDLWSMAKNYYDEALSYYEN